MNTVHRQNVVEARVDTTMGKLVLNSGELTL